jgi:hypothetical protein
MKNFQKKKKIKEKIKNKIRKNFFFFKTKKFIIEFIKINLGKSKLYIKYLEI